MKSLNKAGITLFLGILAVSTASLLIRKAQGTLPSTVIAAGRLISATLILAPFGGKRALREFFALPRAQRSPIILAGFFLGIHFLVWIISLEMTSVASSVILVTTTPIWVALFSPLVLKETITRNVMLGLVIAMLGIVVLFLGPQGGAQGGTFDWRSLLGNFLALVGAWMAAAYTMVGRKVRDALPLKSYVFLVNGVAALVAATAALPDLGKCNLTWLGGIPWVFLLGLIPQVIGHTLFNAAVRQMDAVYASIALLGEPIGSIILAWIFLSEKPGRYDLLGGLFVIGGILLAFLYKPVSDTDHTTG